MVAQDDWRLANASFLKGASFRQKQYYQWSPEWDHDHCKGCWAVFSIGGHKESLDKGFAIAGETSSHGADYYWICSDCFNDLKESLGWSEVSN